MPTPKREDMKTKLEKFLAEVVIIFVAVPILIVTYIVVWVVDKISPSKPYKF